MNVEVNDKKEAKVYLQSWNDTQTKQNIIDFVEEVTNENSPNYIKVEDRIATFDNDGNLWLNNLIISNFVLHWI
jgi:hypothetical protein